ncbi:MAG: response regulator [Magnetovibrionaceae bacterium]
MNDDQQHLLCVDDDDRIRSLLQQYLTRNGFRVTTAADADEAERKLGVIDFDLMVLDRMMPGRSGDEFAQSLQGKRDIPILMLTAMGEPSERIEGLEAGADDYLAKPFEPRELLLRIQSILKRRPQAPQEKAGPVRLGDLVFDPDRGFMESGGEALRLTESEASLLGVFAKAPGATFSREDLIERTGATGGGRAIDVQVTRLRRKLEPDPKVPRYLVTVRGKGYALKPD